MSYSDELTSRPAGPVTDGERLACLDALRGVAVLGILVMNIYAFAMPFPAYSNPLAWGGTGALDIGTWFVTHILFDQKFMSIFSMLFGAGMILMMDRAESRGGAFGPVFYRRTFWLLLLGMLHGYLIWFGDILFHYALLGMVIYLFRKAPPAALITIACLILPVTLLINFASSFYVEDLQSQVVEIQQVEIAGEELDDAQQKKVQEWNEIRPFFAPSAAEIQEEVDAYKGGYVDVLAHRVPFVVFMQVNVTLVIILWRVGGLMLIGMALMKLGVLSGERSTCFYHRMALWSYGLGLPLTIFSAAVLNAHEFDPLFVARVGGIPNYIGSILVAFGHIAAVILVVRHGVFRALVRRFVAVGRMALSNYLMHSVVLTTIFYGYGLSLYAEVPRFWQQGFVVGLVALQLLISPWWLERFNFGPVEWLWRSLTYGQRQPMRR
jgi:uncharacterized protein